MIRRGVVVNTFRVRSVRTRTQGACVKFECTLDVAISVAVGLDLLRENLIGVRLGIYEWSPYA